MLQGYATIFNQVTPLHHGVRKLVRPGAFNATLNSGVPVKFMLGGHYGDCIASTADNLWLYSDDHGLGFRLRFPNTTDGNQALAIAKTNVHTAAMSIGFDYDGAHKQVGSVGGFNDVVVISRAWLHEITWLYNARGAINEAFASYENVDHSSLRDDCLSGKIISDGAAARVRLALQKLMRAL